MKKVIKYIKSIVIVFYYKLVYNNRLSISFFNSIDGKLSIDLNGDSSISIGKKIMTRGPVYFKALNSGSIKIGDNVFFNHNCCITAMKSIEIGSNCSFGNNLVIVDHNHINIRENNNEYSVNDIKIGDNVWCGANVTILKNVVIGTGAIIGAGSVVNKNIPAGEVWAGNPIKKIK